MTKYIVLFLNALAKLQNPKEAYRQPAFMGNCSTCSHIPWPYQSTKWFAISLFQVVCDVWDSVATREMPVDKKVDLKFIKVTLLKNIARMTRRLYVLVMSHTRFRVNLHSVLPEWEELLPRNRRDIWRLSDSNGVRIHNNLVWKRTLNHLSKRAKWLNG